jgi:hypothetical protein
MEGVLLNGVAGLDHNAAIVGEGHMAISLNEIAQQSGTALDQIRSYPINWSLASIAIVVVGCWLLAELIESFEDRKRMRRRFTRPLG